MVDGVCRSCMKRREVFSITRRGGGNYRRGGRTYRSSICLECAVTLHENGWSERFSKRRLAELSERASAGSGQ